MAGNSIFRMKIFAIIFASLLLVAAIGQPAPNQKPDRTWITDVKIISPENLDHVEKGSVLIENGHIVRVERGKGAKKPAGATVVSGEGQFLIPGLIDSHVHLASDSGTVRHELRSGRSKPGGHGILQTTSAILSLLRLYHGRRSGVSTTRHWRTSGRLRCIRIYMTVGESLPFANGYPMSFAPPAMRFKLFPNFIYDPAGLEHPF